MPTVRQLLGRSSRVALHAAPQVPAWAAAASPLQVALARGTSTSRREPSLHVKALAEELFALSPEELTLFRKECRERLTPKPSGQTKPVKKDYNPVIPIRRSDRPFPMRSHLQSLGQRFTSLHPIYVFAGQGPGVMPTPMPAITAAIMAPHASAIAESMAGAVDPAVASSAAVQAATPVAAEEPAEETPDEKPQAVEEKAVKATVNVKLLRFDVAKKINVIKEVRALTGAGLKESKEKVENLPTTLQKGVPREEAEALAEKLRAIGAEVSLD